MSAEKVEEKVECTEGAPGELVDADEKNRESEETDPSPDLASSAETELEAAPPPVEAAPVKYRYDWYQTEADVCINVLIKKVKKENVHINFEERLVSVRIEVGEDDIYNLSLPLSHSVNVSKCSTKVYGTKVELRMRKCDGLHWDSLEAKNCASKLKLPGACTPSEGAGQEENTCVHKYPSSSHYTRDWDKLVADVKQEEKEEKPEGDAALNKLFQQIYKDGNDQVKKAMNKSFMESGGTVLSTNWGEIGKKKVERKPPDGMEWKQYEK